MKAQNPWHISVEHSIADLLRHPALHEFARHLLPTPEDAYCHAKLKDLATLLPWHQNVHPDEAIQAINRLIDDTAKGCRVFHSFYKAISLKERAGLFFFKGRVGAPFALICSGGGFRYLGALHEGLPFAHYLSRRGFNAFALQYRLGNEQEACRDMAQALSWIFRNAQNLEIALDGYSVWGASAGGRMAANLGSFGNENLGGDNIPQPAGIILAYTARAWITGYEPPTFAVISTDDSIASAHVMAERTKALAANGIDAEILVVDGAGHGFGIGTGTKAEGWIDLALDFWLRHRCR